MLAVTAVGKSLQDAIDKAYKRIDNKKIHFEGMHYRRDIARKAFQSPASLPKVRLAVLGSTRGTVMQAIIDAINAKTLYAGIIFLFLRYFGFIVNTLSAFSEISIVVSNREDAYILQRAKDNNIEHVCLPSKGKTNREAYDADVIKILDAHSVDLVLLIGTYFTFKLKSGLIFCFCIVRLHANLVRIICATLRKTNLQCTPITLTFICGWHGYGRAQRYFMLNYFLIHVKD